MPARAGSARPRATTFSSPSRADARGPRRGSRSALPGRRAAVGARRRADRLEGHLRRRRHADHRRLDAVRRRTRETGDLPVVANATAAGMVTLGKLNMTELAYSGLGLNPHFGTPVNPNDRKTLRSPGGSSSGQRRCGRRDGWCPAPSAPTPAARCAFRRPSTALSATRRARAASTRPASSRWLAATTRSGRWRARSRTASCSTCALRGAVTTPVRRAELSSLDRARAAQRGARRCSTRR